MSKNFKKIIIIILLLTSILLIVVFIQKKYDENSYKKSVEYEDKNDKKMYNENAKCIVEKESMYRNVYLGKGTYNQLCNYKDTFIQDLIINDKYSLVNNIYLMSKIDKDFSVELTKKYITKDFTKDLTPVKLLQTYTFLERVYGYNKDQIKDIFGIELNHNYRFDKNLSLKKIFLGEGILTMDYDKEKLEMEDLNLIDLVANFEANSIIGTMNIYAGLDKLYKSIANKEGKEKFINIIRKILKIDKEIKGQDFYITLKFLDDNNKIDRDFFNVIKEILLEKSKEIGVDSYFRDAIKEYIYIIKKYDKNFAKTILNNFNQKNIN